MTGVCAKIVDGNTVYRASIQVRGAYIHLIESSKKVVANYAYWSAWRMATGDKKKGFVGRLGAQERADIELRVRERLLTARYPEPRRGVRRKDLLVLQSNIEVGQKWYARNKAAARKLPMLLTVDTIIEPNEFNPWRVVFFEQGGVLFGHELLKRYRALQRKVESRGKPEVFACRVCGKAGRREDFFSNGVMTKTCADCRAEIEESVIQIHLRIFSIGSVWSWKRDKRTRCVVTSVNRMSRFVSICFDEKTKVPASRALKEMVRARVLNNNARARVARAVQDKMQKVRIGQVWLDERGREREVTAVVANPNSPFVMVRFGNLKTTATHVVARMKLAYDPNPTKGEPEDGQEAEEGHQVGHEETQVLMA